MSNAENGGRILSGGVSRRNVLTAGVVGVGGLALAGCSQAAQPGSDTVTTPATTASSAGAGASGSASGGASGSATAGAGSSAAAAGPALAKLSDIKVGEAIAATGADGSKIIISRPTATTVAGFSAICTHQGCAVAPAGKQLDCPCHGSVFDVTTGAVLNGPASRPLPAVKVAISGTNIVAG
ncbi:QcrA and Rieske domain-containing protein [Jatrophihabitans lederbergiae]|uniref:Cytochrome bc1 complex Rieske iron-sulfur subunit n=1 Tax=Jatrophihabitans lederbergiae TaxID=3075547 RepID=A0ABU2JEF4_9ACTN|nr:Rieske (2Fe-2S) protein [Jatrophihabitans sp. DSM 44399]MDT0262849.1 Rieske (2Fe-2S) protein [Jatrophihabitans sp. DSM 44399]